MAKHVATISWRRDEGSDFLNNKYSRAHSWRFDGGAVVAASPSPDIVPVPYSQPANVDPEEAFVASLSSCHMLFYLHKAREAGFVVDSYEDDAVGRLAPGPNGKLVMTKVTLNPRATYSGTPPTREEEEHIHHLAHEECFIANSVTTQIETNLA